MKRPEGFDRAESAPPQQPPKTQPPKLPKLPKRPPRQERVPDARPSREEATKQRRPDAAERESRKAEKRAARRERHAEKSEAKRFTRHTRRRRFTLIGVISVFGALVVILAIAIFSPLLALRDIRVDGTNKISPTAVREAVSSQLGTPLALIDDGKIHSELGKFTLIRSYSTTLIPPNTISIHVVERQPVGVLQHGKSFEQVDPAGVVLARTPTAGGLPVIDIGDAKRGGPAFEAAVRVLLAMPASVSHLVQTVSATTIDDVSLTLTGATSTVIWGSSSDSDLKASVLSKLLALPACSSQPVVDVSAPLVAGCGPVHVLPTASPTPTPTPTSTPSALPQAG